MPTRSEDLCLRALFAIGRDDVLAGERRRSVDLVEHRNLVRFDMDIRSCRQTGQRNHHKDNAQGKGQRAEIRSRSIDEEAEESRSNRREDEI